MPVRAGHWQQKSGERSKPLRRDAIFIYIRRPLNISHKDHVTNKEVRNRIQHAIGVHDPLAWRRQFCRGQWKEQEGEEDRRKDGKITSRNGQEWRLEIPWGQRKTGKDETVLLQHHLWCPDNLRGYGTERRWFETNCTVLNFSCIFMF